MLQNMYDKALEIYIQLSRPDVFDFIAEHALLSNLSGKFTALFALNAARALEVLCANAEDVNPSLVMHEIQAVMAKCKEKGNEKKEADWRMLLFKYCDRLISVSMTSAPDEVHVLLVRTAGNSGLRDAFCCLIITGIPLGLMLKVSALASIVWIDPHGPCWGIGDYYLKRCPMLYFSTFVFPVW